MHATIIGCRYEKHPTILRGDYQCVKEWDDTDCHPSERETKPVTMIQQLPRYTNQSTKKINQFFLSSAPPYKQPTKHQTTQMWQIWVHHLRTPFWNATSPSTTVSFYVSASPLPCMPRSLQGKQLAKHSNGWWDEKHWGPCTLAALDLMMVT